MRPCGPSTAPPTPALTITPIAPAASGRVTTDTPAGRRHPRGEYAAGTWRSFEEAVRPLPAMAARTSGPAS